MINDTPTNARAYGTLIALACVITALLIAFDARHTFLSDRARPILVYPDSVRTVSSGAVGWVDRVTAEGQEVFSSARGYRIANPAPVRIQGWGIDLDARGPLAGVSFDVDGGGRIAATYGIPRADISLRYNCPCDDSGFIVEVPVARLPAGRHRVVVHLLINDLAREVDFAIAVVVGG